MANPVSPSPWYYSEPVKKVVDVGLEHALGKSGKIALDITVMAGKAAKSHWDQEAREATQAKQKLEENMKKCEVLAAEMEEIAKKSED